MEGKMEKSQKVTEKKASGSESIEGRIHELRIQIEKKLIKFAEEIEKSGEEEVDLSDESPNNAFLKQDGQRKEFLRRWKKLCESAGCNPHLTGRKVEKAIKLGEVNAPGLLIRKVEDYVNKLNFKETPSFSQIRNVVLHERHGLPADEQIDVDVVATALFRAVMEKLRDARMKDLRESINYAISKDKEPPQDQDPELQKQLEENMRLAMNNLLEFEAHLRKQYPEDEEGNEDSEDADDCNDDNEDDDEDEKIGRDDADDAESTGQEAESHAVEEDEDSPNGSPAKKPRLQ